MASIKAQLRRGILDAIGEWLAYDGRGSERDVGKRNFEIFANKKGEIRVYEYFLDEIEDENEPETQPPKKLFCKFKVDLVEINDA